MATASKITLTDGESWTKGAYLGYLAPWGAGSLVQGRDYVNTLTLTADLFPNSVTMSWKWPNAVPATGVYNFNAIDFGNYNHTVVQSPIASLQVKSIGTLNQTHSIKLGGDTSKYDVITDFFLTAKAGDLSTKLFEVQVFLHTPAYSKAYVQSVTGLGTYTDVQGRAWTVALDKNAPLAPDIILMPKNAGDVLTGSVDLKGMLDWLTAKGVITGNEYFNGLGMGAEVQQGAGSLTIADFAVDYAAKTAANRAPVIDSDGGGASAALTVLAGTKAVTSVHAMDADGTTPAYAIKGGADAALFTIDARTGTLAFKAAPSYAAPKDAGGDNVYNVTVQASDGSATDQQALAVSVQPSAPGSGLVQYAVASETYNGHWQRTSLVRGTQTVQTDAGRERIDEYDARGALTAVTQVSTAGQKVVVESFDARGHATGTATVTQGTTGATTEHYDAAAHLTARDVFAVREGKAVEQRYDARGTFTGMDVAVRLSATKDRVEHSDAGGASTGFDLVHTSGGKLTTQHYAPNGAFLGAETQTLEAARALDHDPMKAWLLG